MTHASLFSGIGGPDLAAEWMGWENIFHCEINPFGQQILKHYWPDATLYEDIITTDFSIHRGTIDVLTGGFPCQPYSLAGLRKGKEDERHLWPEMLRAIREIKPRWVVGENVLGLVGWNDGLVFEEVQTDLEAEGYEVQPYVLPAASVGAPHRRDRVWFVAYAKSYGSDRTPNEAGGKTEGSDRNEIEQSIERSEIWSATNTRGDGYEPRGLTEDRRKACESESVRHQRERVWPDIRGISEQGNVTHPNGSGFQEKRTEQQTTRNQQHGKLGTSTSNANGIVGLSICGHEACIGRENQTHSINCNASGDEYASYPSSGRGKQDHWERNSRFGNESGEGHYWDNWPTQPPVCDGNDGISSRLDGITFSKWRTESIKAGGNAIVPQVIHQIFKAIQKYEQL